MRSLAPWWWTARRPSERIRVVCLIGQIGYGGSERQVYLVLRGLDPQLFERHLVVFNPVRNKQEYAEPLAEAGVRVWRVPESCRSVPCRVLYLTRLFLRLRPHVVHSWTAHDNPYAGIAGTLGRAPGRLGSVRGSYSSAGLAPLGRLARFLSLHSVPTVVVNARSIAEELHARGHRRLRPVVMPNAVERAPTADANGSREWALDTLGVGQGRRFVLIVGNIRPVKNHRLFIQTMALLAPRFPDVRGVIVGERIPAYPDLPEELQTVARELGMEDVVLFPGFRSDVKRLLPHASVVCLTSDEEGMPNVVAEAMAAGRPVVATRVGGVPEMLEDGVTGLLVEPGDADQLADALSRVLADAGLAARLGEQARRSLSSRFTVERVAARFGALYAADISAAGAARSESTTGKGGRGRGTG